MVQRIDNDAGLRRDIDRACKVDTELAKILAKVGYPAPRVYRPGYDTMLQIMVSQQLSTKAAAAIWSRLVERCLGDVSGETILELGESCLRECGLSMQKIRYAKALAIMLKEQRIDIEPDPGTDCEEVIKLLCNISGVGRWTAEIYAMFALGYTDIYPANDLALQVAVQRYLKLDKRLNESETRAVAIRWKPYRSAVSLLMWRYYGSTTMDG